MNHKVHEIDLDNVSRADIKLKIADKINIALVDTGAACSWMSEETHKIHGSSPLRSLFNMLDLLLVQIWNLWEWQHIPSL